MGLLSVTIAFRAGMPLGSLALGKLIPVFGVSSALAGAGLLLVAVSVYFLLAKRTVNTNDPLNTELAA